MYARGDDSVSRRESKGGRASSRGRGHAGGRKERERRGGKGDGGDVGAGQTDSARSELEEEIEASAE